MSVSPGPVATDLIVKIMQDKARVELGDVNRWQSYLAKLPLGRAATVEEIADVAVFMASERAGFINGSVVNFDGGHGANQANFT